MILNGKAGKGSKDDEGDEDTDGGEVGEGSEAIKVNIDTVSADIVALENLAPSQVFLPTEVVTSRAALGVVLIHFV